MSFIQKNDIIAKLTPMGKRKLINNNLTNLITKFALGDSDANYMVTDIAPQIVDISGNENTTFHNIEIKHKVFYNVGGFYKHLSDLEKYTVSNYREQAYNFKGDVEIIKLGDGADATQNLLKTINAPITNAEKETYINGIYSKNAYGQLLSDKYYVLPISYQGDILDGNDVKITIGNDKKTFTLYSTLPEGTNFPNKTIIDDSKLALSINKNMVPLFSDDISSPMGGGLWSDGHGKKSPFDNGKKLFNVFTSNDLTFGDKIVGYLLLDKGLIVLTEDQFISAFAKSKVLNVEVESKVLIDYLAYEVVCHINRNEFISSTNPTYNNGDALRISEIGLYDEFDELIAIAKVGEQVVLDRTKPVSLSISISF